MGGEARKDACVVGVINGAKRKSVLEATQGQIDGFFSQLPFKCYPLEVASVGDSLKICPWVAFSVDKGRDAPRPVRMLRS